jgi:hypothetical protein
MSFSQLEKESAFVQFQKYVLESTAPFFIGRLSGNETRLCGLALSNNAIPQALHHDLLYGAGLKFQSQDDIRAYVKTYMTACKHCHLLGVWDGSMYSQAKEFYSLIPRLLGNTVPICAHALEPYYFMHLPEYAMDRVFYKKKVLIVTSHLETTREQLAKLPGMFAKPIFHETTEFVLYKPAQQNGGNHDGESWTTHFTKMKTEIESLEFDVALVAAGGFGMPLCDFIYENMGKSVVYVGGALQLFFGIMGSRWESSSAIRALQNERWTRPVEADRPKQPRMCENGCYW